MKFLVAFALLVAGTEAFLPASSRTTFAPQNTISTTTARSFGVDPSAFHELPQHFDAFQGALTSFSLADAAAVVADAADMAPDAAVVADAGNGWFGFLVGPISGLLQVIHSSLVGVGVSGNAWGVSIIALTVLVKALTFPLTKTQLEGTTKMQTMQPAIKEIQAKYQSNPEVMNQKIAEFYQVNEINPLAGCLPSIVQIPVFIGLYRAVLTLAKDDKLNEPFLWLPNLEGPTYGADPAHGSDWILKGWVDGVPSLGWETTICFLILPVALVASQALSMQLMQPKTDDPAAQQSNAILKFLPLMIGWFSLNVPAALCIYWITNNVVTTATSVYIRNSLTGEPVTPVSGGAATMDSSPAASSIFTPPREKPAGFGATAVNVGDDGVKPITAIDAVIEDVSTDDDVDDVADDAPSGSSEAPKKKKQRGKKSKKRKN